MSPDETVDALIAGTLDPWHLPHAARDIYWLAWDEAEAAVRREQAELRRELAELKSRLDRAERDADTWYERALNPGRQLTEVRERRVQQALEEAATGALTEPQQLVVMVTAAQAPRRAA